MAVDALTTRRDPPLDRLVEVLIAIGKPARPVVAVALRKDHSDEVRAALERARDGIEGTAPPLAPAPTPA